MAQAATHNRMNDLTTLQKTQSRNMNCSIGFGYECPDWRTENKNYENTMRLIGDVSDTRGSQRFLHRGDLTCKFDKVLYNSDIVKHFGTLHGKVLTAAAISMETDFIGLPVGVK
nr:PREDICTED: uncharacterized protein LOC106702761 isoform X1 [Latimeria chalumnae]|eukprot:XP_014341387.1 PREDICTED: uncharacterized protein LOC106702761 isoform X1 [Latimeria chalumnae]